MRLSPTTFYKKVLPLTAVQPEGEKGRYLRYINSDERDEEDR